MPRLSKDDYLWHLAFAAARRGTCDRLRAGCVVARDGIVVATGYNGSAPGEPHCDEAGHRLVSFVPCGAPDWQTESGGPPVHCLRTIHAEINAIINAAYLGVSIRGCDWYVTGVSCPACSKAIARLDPERLFFCSDLGADQRQNHRHLRWWRERYSQFGRPLILTRTMAELRAARVVGEQ